MVSQDEYVNSVIRHCELSRLHLVAAEAVSPRLRTAAAQFRTKVKSHVINTVALAQVFFKYFGFYIRFEGFTAVTMYNGVSWDVTPRGSCKNRRFGGT
jgi:hypothetical protein